MRHWIPVSTTLALLLAIASPASAGHHRWDFTEVFSNPSGTIQYVELFSLNANEAGLGPFTVTASGNTFNFVTNLPSSATANTWVLIGTTAFAALPGAPPPDYVLPDSFFSTAGGTLNYASGADIWIYGAVPTDGTSALARDGSTPTNSPTNFAGTSGSVDASPPPGIPSVGVFSVGLAVLLILIAASGVLRRREPAAA